MKKLEVRFTRRPADEPIVGTLAEQRGRIFFEYAPEFLRTGLNLSPFRLPFEARLFEHADLKFGPLPGLFDDSLPDGWGLLLMDRSLRQLGLRPGAVGPLDRLAWLGRRTMGALTYHPPSVGSGVDQDDFNLHALAAQSKEILAGKAVDILPQLVRAGGSPGGARPKVLVGWNSDEDAIVSGEEDLPEGFSHWIVKFASHQDSEEAGPMEQAYSLMARAAGIDMPATRLFTTAEGDRFFGVQRFDRKVDRRMHVHTFGNLIQSNFRIPSNDYSELLKVASLLTRDQRDVEACFRRMVFNVLAHNRDDHVKNFAFLLDDESRRWSLAPAYDLTFTDGPGGEHTMTIDGEGRAPGRQHMIRLAEQAGLTGSKAGELIGEIRATVRRWPDFAAQAGVSAEAASAIGEQFSEVR